MEKENFKKGIQDIREIKMTKQENSLVFQRLENYISQNPIKNTNIKSPWYVGFIHLTSSRSLGLAFSVFIIVLIGAKGVSVANNSLPGDRLYSLKVDVVEPLQYRLAVDSVSKANVILNNLDTRFKEAEILQVKGELSDSVQLDIENRLKNHQNDFNNVVSVLENKGDSVSDLDDVKVDFEAKIDAHYAISSNIDSISKNSSYGKSRQIVESIRQNSVYNSVPAVSNTRVATAVAEPEVSLMMMSAKSVESDTAKVVSTSTIDKNTLENRKKATIKIIKNTKENIEKLKNIRRINQRLIEFAENSLKEAENSLKEAEKYSKSGETDSAYSELLNSRKKAKEADTSINMSKEIDD